MSTYDGSTSFTEAERTLFRQRLEEKRHQVVREVEALRVEGLARDDAELSGTPIHPADRATENGSRRVALARFEAELALLVQIDRALAKIDEGTYGVCEETGAQIAKERLEAKPWARFCVEVQRAHEASA